MRTRPNRISFRRTIVASGSSTTSPTGFWNLNQASGSTRTDSCSSPADLFLSGTVTQVTGKISFAAQAASGFNYLNNGVSTKLNTTSSFSVAGWFKLDNISGGTLACNGTGSNGWKLSASSTSIVLTTFQSFGVSTNLTKSVSISTGTWYFVVGYFNGSQFGLSLDGGSFSTGAGTACAGANGITLLNDGIGGSALQGSLDEFGYWVGYAITGTEKDDLYNSGSGKTFNGSAWV